jgi:cell pole-organizing protein PopZ
MEEILASIRRIIADDQEGPKAAQPAPPPAPAARPAAPPPAPAPAARPKAEEEVLDLADIATPVPPRAAPLEMEHEDISFRDTEEFDAPELEKDEAPEPVWDLEPEPEPEPVRAPPPPSQPEPPTERLISTSTDASVNNAFNMLAHTVLSNNARTLEDLVKEMLKPMLKSWLDENLPTLVERLVRAEIERVTRGR